jgi:O-antigen ligase
MPLNIKELFLVLVLAWPAFKLAKPVALTFTLPKDFERRRNAWFALTIVAFLSPSFWLYVAIAIPILVVTGRKDSNPVAVYLMLLQVTPIIGQSISVAGSSVFDLNTYMLLSFCILAPVAIRILRTRDRVRYRELFWIDLALLGYGVFNAFHYLQAETPNREFYPITTTDSIRRVFVFVIITYIPYFVTSRLNANRRALVDSLAAYCLACGLMSVIALFETLRGWLLYIEMPGRLGDSSGLIAEYLIRGSALRAMASSGHPLTLATLLSIAVALWLYLRTRVESRRARLAFSAILAAGLFVTYSRGPWLGAAVACLGYVLLQPRAVSALFKTTIGILLGGTLLSFTPFGQKILSLLPVFGGSVDVDTLTYRERLLDRAITVISEHPYIGDTKAFGQMQDLRQGEGIIDLVNVYIQVLLNNGIIGLTLFLGFMMLALAKANAVRRRSLRSDIDTALLGASLMGSIFGLFVTLAGGSLGNSERIYIMLGALTAAYVAGGSMQPNPSTAKGAPSSKVTISTGPIRALNGKK